VTKFARWLVGQQLVHFVGSDAHGARARRPLLRRAFDCVASFAGYETAVHLCCRNPALVVAGRTVTPRPQRPTEPRMAGWFRWTKAS
jgi:tyrosine-protein phosphatase YwqE